jgi:superfamily I DNA and/or RNA helicase
MLGDLSACFHSSSSRIYRPRSWESKTHFDLCIMDESGQCNMATALIPIVRATDLLLVGDTNSFSRHRFRKRIKRS